MRDVLKMAHERGIRMAMGFEFGVIPPEYFSLNVPEIVFIGQVNEYDPQSEKSDSC